jgi:hypothetical protein
MIRIKVPSELKEITLRQYQSYVKVLEQNPTVTQFLKHKTIEIFCGLELKTIDKLPKNDVDSIYEILRKMIDEEVASFQQTFKLKGKEFGFIPNFEGITSGEFIDISNYINSWSTMHKAMSVMFRPIEIKMKERYIIEPYESSDKYANDMLDLPLDKALGAVFFLVNSFKILLSGLESYLEDQITMNPELKKNLATVGGGINQSTTSLREIFSILNQLPNRTLMPS